MLNDFFEEDEPAEYIHALWERGEKGLTAPPCRRVRVGRRHVQAPDRLTPRRRPDLLRSADDSGAACAADLQHHRLALAALSMPDVQPTREAIASRLERSRTQLVALHDEALEALRALDDWDAGHDASTR